MLQNLVIVSVIWPRPPKYKVFFISVSVGCHDCCIWGHHWSLRRFFSPVDGNAKHQMWCWWKSLAWATRATGCPPRIFFHGCYFVVMCICGNIRNIKCTVIGQAIFHFTCNTLVQKEMYCINTYVHILFFYVLLTLLNKYLNFHGLL